ncbi:MAG: hypothetical protein QXD76_02375, partial [Sulfolobales archaeon]
MKVRSLREIRDLCINSFSECEEEVYRVYENIRRYENDLRAYITLRPLKEVLEDLKRSIERRGVLSGVL